MESSITLNTQVISSVILNGGTYYGGYYQGAPTDASQDYLPVTDPNGTVTETADQVRAADLATLFAGMVGGSVRVTRMRSDISHAAMTTDFVLQASPDQSELTNVRQVTQSINEQCPVYNSNCEVTGTGSPAQEMASGPRAAAHGCSATLPNAGGFPFGLGAVAGLVGLAALRARRQRRFVSRVRDPR
jgi:hypothetical protein